MTKMLALNFGAMADSLADQILQQGLVYRDTKALEHFQRDADAISRLSIRGYLADSLVKSCRMKLMKKINTLKETS